MARQKPVFHLYVSGATPRSTNAITNLKPVLGKLFEGGYELRVTDIYQEPQKANTAHVYVAPTLVREHPEPVVRMVGGFSSEDEIRSLLIARFPNETPDE
jgi:circadian clock protein KaiB